MNETQDTAASFAETLHKEPIRHLHLPPPPSVTRETSLKETIGKMRENKYGAVLIFQADRLVGIFTERDVLMKLLGKNVDYGQPVERYMTPDPRVLGPNDSLIDAIQLMTEGNLRHIPIVDPDGCPVAMLGARDLVDFIAEHFPAEVVNLPPRLHQTSISREGA